VLPKVFALEKLDNASLGGLIDLVGTATLGTTQGSVKTCHERGALQQALQIINIMATITTTKEIAIDRIQGRILDGENLLKECSADIDTTTYKRLLDEVKTWKTSTATTLQHIFDDVKLADTYLEDENIVPINEDRSEKISPLPNIPSAYAFSNPKFFLDLIELRGGYDSLMPSPKSPNHKNLIKKNSREITDNLLKKLDIVEYR